MDNFSGRFRRMRHARLAIAAVIVLGCGGGSASSGDRSAEALRAPDRLWVLAPHPDDELLMASELLHEAVVRGRPHTVLVMTNGDLSCTRDGHARQRETIAALAELGVAESDVRFLGYPDGWLDALGPQPFPPLPRTRPDGTCGDGDHTYASHGAGGIDVHTSRTGEAGAYVASGPTDDLVWLLERERPSEIVTTHAIDLHPDHAMTYAYLRRALERAAIDPPRVLRSLVHQGPCWPNGAGVPPCPDVRLTQGTPFPALAPPLEAYAPPLRVPVADGGALARAAIAHYTTQLETPIAEQSWLSSFARADEIFWPDLAPAPTDELATIDAAFDGSTTRTLAPVTLVIDSAGATLRRGDVVLRQLPIPHGEDTRAMHTWQLRRQALEGNEIDEISVRRDGEFWMLAVVAVHLVSDGAPQSDRLD
jgi:LmbE family N-acetylglucosaminyl deacetylase